MPTWPLVLLLILSTHASTSARATPVAREGVVSADLGQAATSASEVVTGQHPQEPSHALIQREGALSGRHTGRSVSGSSLSHLARGKSNIYSHHQQQEHEPAVINHVNDVTSTHRGRRDVFQPLHDAIAAVPVQFQRDPARPSIDHVALFKTHKTASTTLASLLFRYAARHQSRVFKCNSASTVIAIDDGCWRTAWHADKAYTERLSFNFVLYHISVRGDELTVRIGDVMTLYNSIVRDPWLLTTLRNPRSHCLSWLCYYMLPQNMTQLEDMIHNNTLANNIQVREYGIKNLDALRHFIRHELNQFSLVCITEYFDECLVMMRRRFNWDMLDITYIRLLDSSNNRYVSFESDV